MNLVSEHALTVRQQATETRGEENLHSEIFDNLLVCWHDRQIAGVALCAHVKNARINTCTEWKGWFVGLRAGGRWGRSVFRFLSIFVSFFISLRQQSNNEGTHKPVERAGIARKDLFSGKDRTRQIHRFFPVFLLSVLLCDLNLIDFSLLFGDLQRVSASIREMWGTGLHEKRERF